MTFQKTLAIIKPDAVDHEDLIVALIQKANLRVLSRKRLHLSADQAGDFYQEHHGKPFYPTLVDFMSSGPIIAMILGGDDAIAKWRQLMGPTDSVKAREEAKESIRAKFGTNNQRNACHGSDSPVSAERETRFFFPNTTYDILPEEPDIQDYLQKAVFPALTKGLTELAKAKPGNPTEWLGQWLIRNNPNKPIVVEPADD